MITNIKTVFALLLCSVLLLIYVACRKVDTASSTPETVNPAVQEDKFFNSHRTNDPLEKTIVEFLIRANLKSNFVDKTIKQVGFPRWDKALITKKTTIGNRGNNVGDSLILIPFVRDTQNFVNASLTVELSANDTLVNWICDWQYASKTYTTDSIRNNSAEEFALFMMMMDAQVFGHKDFFISDTSLFRNLSTFANHPQFGSENTRRIHLEPDSSTGTGNRSSAMAEPAPSYNWTMWYYYIIDYYGLNNFYNSIPDYGSGGGGGGGGTTVPPPPNCGPVAARGQVVEGCTPGWYIPGGGGTNPPPLANQSIIDSLQGYPCAQSILALLPNLNNTTKNILQNSFGVSENFNVIFRADTTMPNYENGATSRIIKNSATNTYDIGIRLNSNMLKNSSKEFILNVMFHESIHAFMNYQWYLYNTHQIDSNTFKSQFPQIWNYKNGSNSQHIQISESYVSHLKQTVIDFNNIADTSMARAISWVGLQATPAWINLGIDTIDIRQKASIAKYGTLAQMITYNLKKCN